MTVTEYAARYNMSPTAIYKSVYAGRISFTRQNGRLDLADLPPEIHPRFRKPDELTGLPDYILALIWFNGTISDDTILVRHKNPDIPETVASAIRASVWQRSGDKKQSVCKIGSATIANALRELGFTGKKDIDRTPPPVEPMAFAKAFTESHSCFGFALQYDRHHPGDKSKAFYTPRITLCSSPAITETFALSLAALNVAPMKRTARAANGASAIYTVTSRSQLENISRVLSADLDGFGLHNFWPDFDAHAAHKTIPYFDYHERSANETL